MMTFLTVCAYDLNEEIIADILKEYQVTVKDRSNDPWAVVFEGSRDNLISMFNKHWTDGGDIADQLESSSPWLTEVFVVPEIKAIEKIKIGPVACEGVFSGMVMDVSGGFVTQKINRDGATVKHAQSVLSEPLKTGDIVDIKYSNGVGTVSGKGLSAALGR